MKTLLKPKITPVVGMGVTVGVGSDAYPATIIEVSTNLKRVTIQMDKATPVEGFDYYKNQVYTFKRDPNGAIKIWTWRKRGVWAQLKSVRAVGYLSFNGRRKYSDPSF